MIVPAAVCAWESSPTRVPTRSPASADSLQLSTSFSCTATSSVERIAAIRRDYRRRGLAGVSRRRSRLPPEDRCAGRRGRRHSPRYVRPGALGGTGVALPWGEMTRRLRRASRRTRRVILAGGLRRRMWPRRLPRSHRMSSTSRRAWRALPGSRITSECGRSATRSQASTRRHDDSAARTDSAHSADATFPKRSFRRSTSSSAPTTRRDAIRRSRPSSSEMLDELRRPAVGAERRAALLGARGRAGLAQARRPEPHRRAQDQQHRGAGAAGAAHGEAADHRRDRRGTARRGDGHGVRAVRPRVRRVHGRGGHAAPVAERLPHAAAWARRSSACRAERGRSRTRRPRRFATGSRTSTTLTTSSARWWGRRRIRAWCAISSR